MDYRKLNKKTNNNEFPLPRVEEMFDVSYGSSMFSTMGFTSGYNQIAVADEDKKKTAFSTPFRLYEFNRMTFGLNNASATYQRLMQHYFREELFNTMYFICDMDDISVKHWMKK